MFIFSFCSAHSDWLPRVSLFCYLLITHTNRWLNPTPVNKYCPHHIPSVKCYQAQRDLKIPEVIWKIFLTINWFSLKETPRILHAPLVTALIAQKLVIMIFPLVTSSISRLSASTVPCAYFHTFIKNTHHNNPNKYKIEIK